MSSRLRTSYRSMSTSGCAPQGTRPSFCRPAGQHGGSRARKCRWTEAVLGRGLHKNQPRAACLCSMLVQQPLSGHPPPLRPLCRAPAAAHRTVHRSSQAGRRGHRCVGSAPAGRSVESTRWNRFGRRSSVGAGRTRHRWTAAQPRSKATSSHALPSQLLVHFNRRSASTPAADCKKYKRQGQGVKGAPAPPPAPA